MSDKEARRQLMVLYTNIRWAISMGTTMFHMHLVFDTGTPWWTLVLHICVLLKWHWRAVNEELA